MQGVGGLVLTYLKGLSIFQCLREGECHEIATIWGLASHTQLLKGSADFRMRVVIGCILVSGHQTSIGFMIGLCYICIQGTENSRWGCVLGMRPMEAFHEAVI